MEKIFTVFLILLLGLIFVIAIWIVELIWPPAPTTTTTTTTTTTATTTTDLPGLTNQANNYELVFARTERIREKCLQVCRAGLMAGDPTTILTKLDLILSLSTQSLNNSRKATKTPEL
jgi:hypothetical protein